VDFLTDCGAVGVGAEPEDAEKDELLEIAEGGGRFKPHCGV
jgi:hypothetical protein